MSLTARTAPPLFFSAPSPSSSATTSRSSVSTKRSRSNLNFTNYNTTPSSNRSFCLFCCASDSNSNSNSNSNANTCSSSPSTTTPPPLPVVKRRNRYRKLYPGESTGITEEMRFVAMRLRNPNVASSDAGGDLDTWQPSMEGFLSYLVDTKLVFNTVERIIDESADVSYAYFRKTGLERSEGISKDLEVFEQQGVAIPEPHSPGLTYAKYLEELAEISAPLFLSHFYNIYFSHIAGGQVISKQVSRKLLEGKELEIFRWEGDAPELLKGVRENLNMLSEHWSRDEKNRCLKETTKSFKFLGQIVRLIIV